MEVDALAFMESPLKYRPNYSLNLTLTRTVSGGQCDWGGRLLKSNGGAQRSPQAGWKSALERIGIRWLDCETYKSSRDESRSK